MDIKTLLDLAASLITVASFLIATFKWLESRIVQGADSDPSSPIPSAGRQHDRSRKQAVAALLIGTLSLLIVVSLLASAIYAGDRGSSGNKIQAQRGGSPTSSTIHGDSGITDSPGKQADPSATPAIMRPTATPTVKPPAPRPTATATPALTTNWTFTLHDCGGYSCPPSYCQSQPYSDPPYEQDLDITNLGTPHDVPITVWISVDTSGWTFDGGASTGGPYDGISHDNAVQVSQALTSDRFAAGKAITFTAHCTAGCATPVLTLTVVC